MLIVVGHPVALASDPLWEQFLSFVVVHGSWTGAGFREVGLTFVERVLTAGAAHDGGPARGWLAEPPNDWLSLANADLDKIAQQMQIYSMIDSGATVDALLIETELLRIAEEQKEPFEDEAELV